jgi:23S rRNA (uracil1939-C5)-methyltransferase
MKPDSTPVKLHVEKVVYGGSGLAHLSDGPSAGRAVFVPYTLPSETIEAAITREHGGFLEAELERTVEPSTNRVKPQCAHFGACGGCHYQHASYEEQLRLKQAILEETLRRAGLDEELPEIQRHAAEPWAYRNRIRLRVAEFDGRIQVGYLRRNSADFLPVRMCPIAAPVLWRAAEALLAINGSALSWLRATEEVEFFSAPAENAVQMTIFVRREPKGFPDFCEAFKRQLPELAGAGVAVIDNSGRGRKALRVRTGSSWGTTGLNYTVRDETYWVTRGAFFQVNRFMVDSLVGLVTRDRRGRLAWDLYAGVGLFSRVLSKSFNEVVAVEAASEDLARTFRGKGRRTIAATTVEFLRQGVLERERPELVVMDPPRAGVGPEVCSLLARIQPQEMVYVSCDPVTLGRDLRAMVDSGYNLRELHLVDMFPQTFHQETVAVLRR